MEAFVWDDDFYAMAWSQKHGESKGEPKYVVKYVGWDGQTIL